MMSSRVQQVWCLQRKYEKLHLAGQYSLINNRWVRRDIYGRQYCPHPIRDRERGGERGAGKVNDEAGQVDSGFW